ncbi:hypothetical protein POX_d04997 [Penicillium oxalicum]|nr:hypothetical protein POX_d04997 [Penicillium oxalicum]KAI2789505.1 hypothetical protein POX_d04997 [Penicillium oxalicum]
MGSSVTITIARSIRVAQAGHYTSSDPPNNNGNDAQSNFLGNHSSRRRKVDKMLQLNTIENGVAHADV